MPDLMREADRRIQALRHPHVLQEADSGTSLAPSLMISVSVARQEFECGADILAGVILGFVAVCRHPCPSFLAVLVRVHFFILDVRFVGGQACVQCGEGYEGGFGRALIEDVLVYDAGAIKSIGRLIDIVGMVGAGEGFKEIPCPIMRR
jgi:hypothetical protein